MKDISDRSLKQAVSNSMKSGSLKVTCINDQGEEEECNEDIQSPCETCKKIIDHPLDAYSYHIINSPDHDSVYEMLFCCKKCWEEYLVKKAGKIKT